jgi:SAM-dependent methyltransferase
MAGERFDDLTDIYEAMIDWPKRLAGEEPFYRRVLADAHVQSVLDVACGTGRHAAMFHAWGLRVEGADLSPNMIRRAQAAFGEPQGLRWVVRGFAEPAGVPSGSPGSFDAAVCVGNSLALAPDLATARQAIHRMFSCVRPGGVIVVHVLNLWRLADGPCLWQKCLRTVRAPREAWSLGDVLVLKGVHRSGSRGFVELVVMRPEGGPPLLCESLPLVGIEAAELADAARRGGASQVQLFGDYQDRPYRREESVDLLMVARK